MKKHLKKFLFAFALVIIGFCLSLYFNREGRFKTISSDAEGYYQYLPAVFIKNDITDQPYSYYLEDGRLFNKYTCGVAIMELPFFLTAHAITSLTDPEEATGYTENYVLAIRFAAVFYLVCGMLLLYHFLRRHFTALVSSGTLLLLYTGTNLFYYTHGEAGMSHVFSFFLFSAFIYLTPHFIEFKKPRYYFLLSVVVGLAVLLRPTNIIIMLFLLLYNVHSFRDLNDRILLFLRHWYIFLLIAAVAVIVYIPQMYYWHKMFGKYFINSYRYDVAVTGFINWKAPKIFHVLAGHRNGWLLYTPLMALSLAGLVWIFIRNTLHSRGVMLIFLIMLYLCASWSAYSFGGSFGYRAFIELYAFLAIPLAFMIMRTVQARSWVLKSIVVLFIANSLFLNFRFFDLYIYWDPPWWAWEHYLGIIEQAYFLN